MKTILYVSVFLTVAFLAGCATTSGKLPLYNWSSYTQDTYKYIKQGEEENIETLFATYQWIFDNQTGTIRETVPPGVCADYGYLLVRAGRVEEGKAFLKKEKELYPESARFVDSIIKKIER